MPKITESQWADPYFAPGQKARPRAAGTAWYWLPRPEDIDAGFLPRSRELPAGDDDEAVRARGRLCREYQRELIAWREGGEDARPRHTPGTWAAVIDDYRRNEDSPYQTLRATTRANYDGYLAIVERAIGERAVGNTSGQDLSRWHRNFRRGAQKKGQEGWVQAKHCMGTIRRLAKWAVWTGHPEAAAIETLFQSRTFKGGRARTAAPSWAQVRAFVREANAAGRWSIATAILAAFELARRRIEIIGSYEPLARGEQATGIIWNGKRWRPGVLWSDIGADWTLTLKDSKQPDKPVKEFDLKLFPALLEQLQAMPRTQRIGPLIVSETSGRPYSVEQFRKEFRKIAAAAGWPPEIWSMDCRAGGATETADAVAKMALTDEITADRIIESLTGHTTKKMAKRYARQTAEAMETAARARQRHREKQG